MKIQTFEEGIGVINANEPFTVAASFGLAQLCSKLLRIQEEEVRGREIGIRVLDAWKNIPSETKNLWNDIVESAGLYPYVKWEQLSGAARVRYELHKSRHLEEIYFHSEQNEISMELMSGRSAIVSAPTSFGKSLLIEEIVASNRFSSIVVIQPTLALLDETRKKLYKYAANYQIILSTTQIPTQGKRQIFLFTAERTVEYRHFKNVDFFILDEFYKLSLNRDDERAIVLNQALYKLLKLTKSFYFLGPNVKSIPDLKEKLSYTWYHSQFSTVALDESVVKIEGKGTKEDKQKSLFELLHTLKEPSLIYCSSPEKATTLALEFLEYSKTNKQNLPSSLKQTQHVVQWISENVHVEWGLVKCLQHSIAIHHGALPRHLGSSIVDLFNERHLRFLFCTSTLIEGVNTSAKNVVLYDKLKGKKPIDYFDYRNIAGRSGRMRRYFIGNVFRFDDAPDQLELDVDIPILTQEGAPLEILIQIDRDELTASSRNKLKEFDKLEPELQLILKRNGGLSIDGQLKVVHLLEQNRGQLNQLLKWRTYPSYSELLPVIQLCWDNLIASTESKAGIRSAPQLTYSTIKYSITKSLRGVIQATLVDQYWLQNEPDLAKRVNRVVFLVLNAARHWFDYKLPKLLSTVSELQRFVFKKHGLPFGDYTYFASQLENAFLPANLMVLVEYDVPRSAIRKLQKSIPHDVNANEIIPRVKRLDLATLGLIPYEIEKIKSI